MRRFLVGLLSLVLMASPALAASVKPLVIKAGRTQVIPAADTLVDGSGTPYGTSTGTVTSVNGTSTTGDLTISGGPITSSGVLSFTVNSAPKWDTARTLSFTSDATGSGSVDGSANVATALTLATVNSNVGSFTNANLTVDAKGRITAASNGSAGSGTVTHTAGALTSGQLVFGNGAADITVGDLSGAVTTSGSGATTYVGTVPVNKGGTGQTSYTNGQLLIGDSGTGGLDKATLTPGSGVSITNAAGSITIAATGASVPTTSLSPPQGRLTLVTGVPVMTSDQTAKTHVYYTPYVGAVVPVYSGSAWALTTLSADLDMALDASNQLIENIYDLYVWNGGSSIGAGPAWTASATITVTIATPAVVTWTAHGLPEGAPVIFTTSGALPTGITAGTTYYVGRSPAANTFNLSTSVANARAGTFVATSGSQSGTHTGTNHTTSRGTGAGTTELQMLNGIWTNKNSITLTNGAGAGTSGIAANTATFVGSAYMTANGQTGMAFIPTPATGGTANILGLCNAYNRVSVEALERESTVSWTTTGNTWGAMNASVGNRISWLDCLQQLRVRATRMQIGAPAAGANFHTTGVAQDATNGTPQTSGQSDGAGGQQTMITTDTFPPKLGLHYVQAVDAIGSGTSTFVGLAPGPPQRQSALLIEVEM